MRTFDLTGYHPRPAIAVFMVRSAELPDLIADTGPPGPTLAREQLEVRPGAELLDPVISLIRLAAVLRSPRRYDQLTHAGGVAFRLAAAAEPTDLGVLPGAVTGAHVPANAAWVQLGPYE